MNNRIIKISVCLLLVVLLASCKKDPETEPRDLFTDDLVWDVKDINAVFAQQFLLNLYNYLPNGLNRFDNDFLESGTDDAVPSRNNTFSVQRYTNGLVSTISNPDGYWGGAYTGIRQVNILLANIDKVPSTPANIAKWKAEARFIRAFLYYELLKRYGGVPLIGDKILALTDNLELSRNTFQQVHDYIVTECDQIKSSLMIAPGADGDWGRVSNAAAIALKCRVYLLGASPLYNGGAPASPQAAAGLLGFTTNDPARWQNVITAAEELRALNYFAIQSSFITVFTNKKNTEVIFAKQSANNTNLEVFNTPVGYLVNGVASNGLTSPSQNLVDAFPMLNGLAITEAGSGYNPAAPYVNRDKRLEATVFYNTLRWLNRPVETFNGGLDKPNTNIVQTKTGYYLRKFLGDFTNSTQFSNTSHNFIYFRYAEILLNYAEALNEVGRTEDAVQRILEVRKRSSNGILAGANNRYGIAVGISQANMRTLIQAERRIELAFEEHRFWDVRRWKIAGTVLNTPIRGMDIIRTAPNVFTYSPVQVSATVFSDKLYYMPLPFDETLKIRTCNKTQAGNRYAISKNNKLTNMKKIIIFLFSLVISSAGLLHAQTKTVTGIISDDKGPLENVTVSEKGVGSNATRTDVYGRFTFTLKGQSKRLLISSTGYAPMEVDVTTQPLSITMTVDPRSLTDVVVIGYSRQKKITLTGAVSQVSGKDIRENPSASLQNGLTGRLPGFFSQQRSGRPGADGAAFFIRGVSSFTGFNEPLIIVDDLEFSYNQFAALDANEVESISILKDASTTAVYGVRGANGVVVVTTRRGKIGRPTVSLRTEFATMEPTILPKYLGAYESAVLVNQARMNDNNGVPNDVFNYTDLELFRNGKDPYGHPDIDWKSVLFKKFSHQTRNNIDVTGGSEKVKYFISLGFINQGGILNEFKENTGLNNNYFNQRFNYRSNLDIKATKNLDIKFDFYGNMGATNTPNIQYSGKGKGNVNGDKNDPFYEFSSFYSLAPFAYGIKNPNGTWAYNGWQTNGYGLGVGSGYDAGNIVGRLNEFGYNRSFTDNMRFMTSLNQKLDFITEGLSVKGLVSYSSTYSYSKSVTRSDIPNYIYNINTNVYTPREQIFTSGKLNTGYNAASTIRDMNLQASVNYDRNFSDHHVYAFSLLNRTSRTLQTTQNANSNFIPVNFQGITTRIGYDYKNKYLFQLNGAYNGTDKFLGDKRFGFFPAVSIGWNMAEENFFRKALPAFSLFKIRGSYGIVGSDALNTTEYIFVQQFTYNTAGADVFNAFPANNRIYTTNFGNSVGTNFVTNLQEGRLANTNITWEKERKLDVGLDFGLFNNKLSGTVDLFFNNRYDILADRQTVSLVVGQTIPRVNIGETKNRGGEVELVYRDYIGKNFSFTIKGNYSYAKNELVYTDELPESIYLPAYQRSTGGPIGNPLMYKWTGTFYKDAADIAASPAVKLPGISVRPGDLKYADIGGPNGKPDGIIDNYDRGFFGQPNLPNTNYGFQLGAQYKDFDFSLVFQGAANFNVSAFSEAIRPFSANLQPIHKLAWTPTLGNLAEFPILTVNRSGISDPVVNSTFWSRRGDYLRLRTAQISYSLPKSVVQKIKMQSVRVYVNGNNLYTWSKLFKLYALDPEVSSGSDRTVYPPQRTYNVGLNITF